MRDFDLDGGVTIPLLNDYFPDGAHIKTGRVHFNGLWFKSFYHAVPSPFNAVDCLIFRVMGQGSKCITSDEDDPQDMINFRNVVGM